MLKIRRNSEFASINILLEDNSYYDFVEKFFNIICKKKEIESEEIKNVIFCIDEEVIERHKSIAEYRSEQITCFRDKLLSVAYEEFISDLEIKQ